MLRLAFAEMPHTQIFEENCCVRKQEKKSQTAATFSALFLKIILLI